jgi:hypothetical protein
LCRALHRPIEARKSRAAVLAESGYPAVPLRSMERSYAHAASCDTTEESPSYTSMQPLSLHLVVPVVLLALAL